MISKLYNHICVPICEPPCKKAECILPNVCHCDDNYTPDPKQSKVCVEPKNEEETSEIPMEW